MRPASLLPSFAVAASALVAAWGACATTGDGSVVARVGAVQITAADFRAQAARLLRAAPGYRDLDTIDATVRQQLLADVIAQKLIVLEALHRGLDREPQIADQVARLEQRALIETLYARQAVPASGQPADEEIESYYRRNHYDTEVLSEQIVCPSADSARLALAELRAGRSFAELAPRYSLPNVRRRFGEDGNIGWFLLADMLPPLVEPMRTMPVGSLTAEPVASSLGFHVFRLNGRREVPLDSVRSVILRKLDSERRSQARARYVSELRERYRLTAHAEALGRLHALPADSKEWPGEDEPLLTWQGGQFTCRDYLALHTSGRVRHPSSLPLPELQKLVDNLAGQRIMMTEARRLGYDRLPDIRAQVEGKRDQLMAAELYRLEGQGKISAVADAQVDSFLLARRDPHDRDTAQAADAASPAVRERARRLLQRSAADRAMDEFIARLRQQYGDQIQVYADVLASIELER